MTLRRIAAVATLRYRESARGPLLVFLVAILVLAAAAALFVPGEPGPERQRAIDHLVFDLILFVTALAAATLGAAPDPADRAAGRDAVLGAGPLRTWERLVGAWLGHGTGLLILLCGAVAGSMAVTEVLSGGEADRPPTRRPVHAATLEGPDGRPAKRAVLLAKPGEHAVFTVPRRPGGPESPEVTVRIAPLATPSAREFPETFTVGVKTGDGPVREVRVLRGEPLRYHPLPGEDVTRIEIRRTGPAWTLALFPDGLIVEGAPGSRSANLGKALLAWLGGLMVLAAAAAALGSFVQAPVAVFGTLLVALVGRSLGFLDETAGYLAAGGGGGDLAGSLLGGLVAIWPDLSAADLFGPVAVGFDIEPARLLGRAAATAGGAGAFLAAAWAIAAWRRRR
ncbi:MAG: hypothetical protein ABFS86_02355 [Planctomycetota bacterium]